MAKTKTTNLLADAAPPLTLRVPDFRRVALTLVGNGGTGSHLASGLAALVLALDERGISSDVLLIDRDSVEPKNVGRQLFSPADVGRNKAEVLAARLNAAFGTRIGAAARAIDRRDTFRQPNSLNVVIGAVDNAAARAMIAAQVKKAAGQLWALDSGNEAHSGQVAIGNCASAHDLRGAIALGMIDRLPAPSVVYPDLVKGKAARPANGRAASCAEIAAGEQGLMVNRMAAAWACAMLNDFLVARNLRYFAVAFDLKWGGTRAWTIDAPTLAEATGLREIDLKAKPSKPHQSA